MITVQFDAVANLLRITYSDKVGRTQVRQCGEQLETLLAQVRPGFRVLTDLSGLTAMAYTCAPGIERIMELCRQQGVAQVVRVIPDPRKDIGFKVMTIFHYRHEIPVVTCETLAEALQALG